jgi:methylphosphotriester-DNA--protein-cysteine methyltransferase
MTLERTMTAAFSTERARWQAVSVRDPAASNAFVYTVSSTGIYCRPTCPARLARRANVGFYDRASEAAALGYRPCKRCKPEIACGRPEDAAVTAVKAFIAAENGSPKYNTLKEMADQVGLSKWHFHRTFVKVAGITPGEWIKQQRQGPLSESSTTNALPTGYLDPLEHDQSAPEQSTAPTTPSTSWGLSDTLGAMPDFQMSDDDWLHLVHFDEICDPMKWGAFVV